MHSSAVKRRWFSLGSAAVVFAIALPVSALAPTDQYDKYSNDTPTILDKKTNLEWDRHPNLSQTTTTIDYPAAMTYDKALTECKGGTRLPTVKELLTIVDEAPYSKYVGTKNEPRYLDQNAFDNTPSDPFWSATLVDATNAYTVDFTTGRVDKAKITGSDSRYVRCVK